MKLQYNNDITADIFLPVTTSTIEQKAIGTKLLREFNPICAFIETGAVFIWINPIFTIITLSRAKIVVTFNIVGPIADLVEFVEE